MKRCPICAQTYPPTARICERHRVPLVEPSLGTDLGIEGPLTEHVLDHRYLLGHLIGRGGMGAVYLAENLRIGQRIAVKALLPELHADPKARQRLFREVLATSRIRHPNVVKIYDYGDDEQAGAYFVMELLGGRSLGALIRDRGFLPPTDALRLMTQLGAALAATHNEGLIHRDLKPSNIRILPNGLVKVLDFGLVKAFEGQKSHEEFSTITTGGIAFGTPWYMSPEQASFQPLDPRSDLYSLGIVLYEMLCGRLPFLGKTPLDVIDAQRHAKPPLPSQLDPPIKLPLGLELLLLKLLAKRPDDRYQSIAELMTDIYAIADEHDLDLGDPVTALAHPAAPAVTPPLHDEPSDATVEVTAPFWPPDDLTRGVQELTLRQSHELAEAAAEGLCKHIPRYRTVPKENLLASVRVIIEVTAEALSHDLREIPEPIKRLADDRADEQFTVTEVIGAFLIGLAACRPLFRQTTGDDLDRYIAMTREVDQRITSLLLKIIDFYVARFNQRLIRQSEMLSRRNDELQALRLQLSSDLRATAGQLAEAEQLKARVTERISSGIMLVERRTHRVLLFNPVMEKLTGVSGTEVLNRPVDEVLHFVEGVPVAEFAEQVQLHGEVGLRKLRLRMANGQEKTVYVRGQVFEGRHNQPDSTLFVIDDVTEREDIIENFSRYVSRDVVNRILRQKPRGGIQPSGELRRAVLLACGIRDFRQLVKDQGPTEVTALLTEYIRTVGDAIFRHGGTIDSVVGDALLVYFAHVAGEPCEIPVEAALDVQAHFDKLNDEREKDGKKPLLVGLGLHVGEIFVLDVGNERRMVHTVVGEPAVIAQALQDIASGGEILLSDNVRRCSNGRFSLAPGPMLTVKGQGNLEVFRLLGLEEQALTATFRVSQNYPERSDPGEHDRDTKPSGTPEPSGTSAPLGPLDT